MKIKHRGGPRCIKEDLREDEVATLAEHCLDGDRHGGQVERAQDTAENNSGAIGKILDKLLSKGTFSPEDVRDVLGLDEP